MRPQSSESMLSALRARGARRLRRVVFRPNRSTIWSLTGDGTVLNLHVAYRRAPGPVIDAFAVIVKGFRRGGPEVREAAAKVRNWPGLGPVLEAVRKAHAHRNRRRGRGVDGRPAHCSATPEQRRYLRDLYAYLNRTRFDGLLPDDIPVRLSNRMTTSLGHMVPGEDRQRGRYVAEIALNADLMLEGNGAERMDTLLHEMAHAADYLFDGQQGHGPTWKKWARHAGCRAEACYDRPFTRRSGRGGRRAPVTRVPPRPRGAGARAGGSEGTARRKSA